MLFLGHQMGFASSGSSPELLQYFPLSSDLNDTKGGPAATMVRVSNGRRYLPAATDSAIITTVANATPIFEGGGINLGGGGYNRMANPNDLDNFTIGFGATGSWSTDGTLALDGTQLEKLTATSTTGNGCIFYSAPISKVISAVTEHSVTYKAGTATGLGFQFALSASNFVPTLYAGGIFDMTTGQLFTNKGGAGSGVKFLGYVSVKLPGGFIQTTMWVQNNTSTSYVMRYVLSNNANTSGITSGNYAYFDSTKGGQLPGIPNGGGLGDYPLATNSSYTPDALTISTALWKASDYAIYFEMKPPLPLWENAYGGQGLTLPCVSAPSAISTAPLGLEIQIRSGLNNYLKAYQQSGSSGPYSAQLNTNPPTQAFDRTYKVLFTVSSANVPELWISGPEGIGGGQYAGMTGPINVVGQPCTLGPGIASQIKPGFIMKNFKYINSASISLSQAEALVI